MKRVLDYTPWWLVIPASALGVCLLLALLASIGTPPVAKHRPAAVSGDLSPHLLPRMEGDPAASAMASDHLLPMGEEADLPRRLASSDAIPVLTSADHRGPQVNTGWLPTDLRGAVSLRPIPLLDVAGAIPQPQLVAPLPRYGSNRMRPEQLPGLATAESTALVLVDSMFRPPVIERGLAQSGVRGAQALAEAATIARTGGTEWVRRQTPIALPPVGDGRIDPVVPILRAPDVVRALPPVAPGLTRVPGLCGGGVARSGPGKVAAGVIGVVVPLPLVEPGQEESAAKTVERVSVSVLPTDEPRLLDPGQPAGIRMFERLFQPIVAEPSSQYGSEVAVEPEARTEDWRELPNERSQEVVGENVLQPLPPVDRDGTRPDNLSAAGTDGKGGEQFNPLEYERCWSLELIAEEADKHTRRGFELAGKKAYFSARLEFTRALRIIAQGLDTERNTNRHSQALAAGLRALDEAEDFMPKDGHLEADLDLAMIAGAHRTPVLQGGDGEQATPLAAIRKYHTYAQEQLATAAGKEVAGSMALCGLGKLFMAIGDQQRGDGIVAARPKAMVLLQAALIVSPGNHMASNELGVLLARSGRHNDARAAFEHSVAAYPTAEGWRNLALTCERLGAMDEAYRAAQQTLALRGHSIGQVTPVGGSQGTVRWVSPADLKNMGGNVQTASNPRTAERAR